MQSDWQRFLRRKKISKSDDHQLLKSKNSLAIIIGASEWPHVKHLSGGKSFINSYKGILDYISSNSGLNLNKENIIDLFDSQLPAETQLNIISDFISEKKFNPGKSKNKIEDIFIYYVGHGTFNRHRRHCLLIRQTRMSNEVSSLTMGALNSCIDDIAPFIRRIIILDCCFSGAAAAEFMADSASAAAFDILDVLPQKGTLLFCSSANDQVSLAPKGAKETMFTGSILAALSNSKEEILSIADLFERTWAHMRSEYGLDAVRPQLHEPGRQEGGLRNIPAFPVGEKTFPASIHGDETKGNNKKNIFRFLNTKRPKDQNVEPITAKIWIVYKFFLNWWLGQRRPFTLGISGIVVALLGSSVAVTAWAAYGLPDASMVPILTPKPSVTYLDRSGSIIATRSATPPMSENIDGLPNYVPLAFVLIEDRNFFSHPSFDPIGFGKNIACEATRKEHRDNLDCSTITQKLAFSLFLHAPLNFKNWIQDLLLAMRLESKFTKKQILSMYLNSVRSSDGIYGIEAASERYFNKPAKDLNAGEASMLASFMDTSTPKSPLTDKDHVARRATILLNQMLAAKVITSEQYNDALAHPLYLSKSQVVGHAQYFIDWLESDIRSLVGEPKENLIVETTLDLPIQTDAERTIQAITERDAKKGVQQAALVSADGEGRIRAMVGGVSYSDSKKNRAIDLYRPAGSSFIPFVYATAMEAGYEPDTPAVDEPYTIGGWEAKNLNGEYIGLTNLQTAVEQSINTITARLANDVGRDRVVGMAHRLGINSQIGSDPVMAEGASAVSPMEMAQAYIPFANGGFKAIAHGIVNIRTASGKILYQFPEPSQNGGRVQVINNPTLMELNEMLRGAVQRGGGTAANIAGYDIAGKTGTTLNSRDAWFVGYTGGFVTAIWVGRDDNLPMNKVTGGSTPASIWHTYMSSVFHRIEINSIPAGQLKYRRLDPPANDAVKDLLGSQAFDAAARKVSR